MEQRETSRLQGAFRIYLDSLYSRCERMFRNRERYEIWVCNLKTIAFVSSGIVGYILAETYNIRDATSIYIAYFIVIWLFFTFLLFRKYVPWRELFDALRRTCCPWSFPIEPTDDQVIQTEEHIASQPAPLHLTMDRVFQLYAQQDASENQIDFQSLFQNHRIEEQRTSFAFRNFLPSRNLFALGRIFCCPWSFPVVPTEDQVIQTAEHIASQPAPMHNAIDELSVFQLNAQPDASENQIYVQSLFQNHRIEEQRTSFAFRNFLPSRNLFALGRIFCCPRGCYPTASTENLTIETEEFAQHNTIEELTVGQSNRILEQMAHEPDSLQATSEEVFAKLQVEEKRFLQYLQNNTESQV